MARCDDCLVNKVCDHNRFGFENCGNFIPADVVPKSEVVAEVIDRLAREGLLNVEPWAIDGLKKEYTEQVCTDCTHFVSCECFSGTTCDQYNTEVKNND